MLLTADEIRSKKRGFKRVEIPEWGGEVICWEMSAVIHELYAKRHEEIKSQGGYESYRAEIVTVCLGDENGKPLFSLEQIVDLQEQSTDVIQKLYDICAELNGLGEKEVKKIAGE